MTDAQAKKAGINQAVLMEAQGELEKEEKNYLALQQIMSWNGGGLAQEDQEEYELLKQRIECLKIIIKGVPEGTIKTIADC